MAAAGMASWPLRALAQDKPLPAYVAWKDASSLIVHSSNTVETKRSAFGNGAITPSNQLYIRNNLPPPDSSIVADRDAWEVSIEGVKNPSKLTLADLKRMDMETVATVLQCSGNGRGFFPSKPSGTPWNVGAAGCVVWSGVPLQAVASMLGGVAEGMLFITGTGGEKLPEGVDPKSVVVERSVPLKALGDAMLAWEMNGEPIPLAHGGPLRLVLPGYQGVNCIKYVKRLAFTSTESDAKIMSHGYRMSPPGTQNSPGQLSVWEMPVKSWINGPAATATLKPGPVQIFGVAFGSVHAIKRVEVSADGGKTWRDARFVGPDLGRFAWRQFAIRANLPAGTHILMSRATDSAGNLQAELREENTGGYNNASWVDHAVKVTVA